MKRVKKFYLLHLEINVDFLDDYESNQANSLKSLMLKKLLQWNRIKVKLENIQDYNLNFLVLVWMK